MKTNKLFLALFAMTVIFESAFGQNGNAAISEVQVYDLGNGSGLVEVRVSGNNSGSVTGGYFTTVDQSRQGSGVLTIDGSQNSPGTVTLSGIFLLPPAPEGNEPRLIDLEIQVQGANSFTGRKRLVRFPTNVHNQG